MTELQLKEKIENLRETINLHSYYYYVKNSPQISDKDFDFLMKELEDLENKFPQFKDPNSPTQRVGSDLLQTGFKHVTHSTPMGSLANTYNIEEVADWIRKIKSAIPDQDIPISSELKFDGTSISVIYRDGKLYRAVTRGDGIQGDDVTENVKTIRSVPLVLMQNDEFPYPEELEVRGEILMPWDVFEELNKERELLSENPFANPRNAASGTLKLLNSKEVAKRKLYAVFYYVLSDNLPSNLHTENLKYAGLWGINVEIPELLPADESHLDQFIKKMDLSRKSLPYATDGLVFKVNDTELQNKIGSTSKYPKWAIAYKFEPDKVFTKLNKVTFETGRMGTVTPVANLEPVLVSGTVVRRATLHNEDYIKSLGNLHEGDYVIVEKAGEIIPQIIGIEDSIKNPDRNPDPVEFPKRCLNCGTELVRIEGEAAWKCPNSEGCRPQILGKFEHFVGRKMMNIMDLGERTLADMYDAGLLRKTSDLYFLTEDDIIDAGIGKFKTANNIIKGIAESKKQPFHKVLYALSISNVGETTAKKLANHFGDIETLKTATLEELAECEDIGPIIAQSISDYFKNPDNIENIELLKECGLNFSCEKKDNSNEGLLIGKSIVISGVFEKHSRDEYKNMIESYGGKNSSSVSKNTSFVLAGADMGPSKKEKCQKLGIPIISENEFLKMIGETSSSEEKITEEKIDNETNALF